MTEKVVVTPLGAVKDICVSDWPSGSFIGNHIESLRGKDAVPTEFGNHLGRGTTSSTSPARYWQACARWALLSKFGGTNLHPGYVVSPNNASGDMRRYVLQMMDADISRITTEWNAVLGKPQPAGIAPELSELLSTSRSNEKELQWAVMECQAGCQFRLHSHPNLELVY
jgi:hypothetical protein